MTTYEHRHRCDIYFQALSKWGLRNQFLVAIEEMSEVQKAITKLTRTFDKRHTCKEALECFENLIEEIADATIMLEQLRYFLGIDEEVDEMIDKKILRLKGRLGE